MCVRVRRVCVCLYMCACLSPYIACTTGFSHGCVLAHVNSCLHSSCMQACVRFRISVCLHSCSRKMCLFSSVPQWKWVCVAAKGHAQRLCALARQLMVTMCVCSGGGTANQMRHGLCVCCMRFTNYVCIYVCICSEQATAPQPLSWTIPAH